MEYKLKRSDIINEAFYDDNFNLIAVINKENLKKILDVDEIILEDKQHR